MRATRNVATGALAGVVVVLGALSVACERAPVVEPDPAGPGADAPTINTARVARVLEPAELGITNPAGLAFSPRAGMLLVVPRTPGALPGSATEIALVTLAGEPAGSIRIEAGVPDPVNVAFDAQGSRLLILDSTSDELIQVLARPDGSLDPEALSRFDARPFGVGNPQGLAVDPESGRLFILDAAGPRIVSVEPEPRLGFASPTVSAIDLAATGRSTFRGLAFDPSSGHLHVVDRATLALHELTLSGQIIATLDLGRFGFRATDGMTFGPSGDTTDDPAELSLYLAERGAGGGAPSTRWSLAETGHITELSFDLPSGGLEAALSAAAQVVTETATLVQTILTWKFSPPSPDPAGITYVDHAGTLLISDSEVNEMSIFQNVNLFEITRSGTLVGTSKTTSFSDEPTGVAYNPLNRHLYVSDDTGPRSVYVVDPGPDGRYGTSDDVVTSFSTSAFGSNDPEGVTYDPSQGVLYVVDGVNAEVYRVSPGANGRFDGVPPAGDDVVTQFDTQVFGLLDPEGIAYDTDYGHLYIVGKPKDRVFHVTTTGTLLRMLNTSAASPRKPAGLAYAPGSVNPARKNLWIVDRGVDNNSDPNENDGKAYEFSLPASSGNGLPTVTITAPPNGSVHNQGAAITFTGTASDPEDGNLTAQLSWSSSRDGVLGTGGSVTTSALSVGTHTITASVTDTQGAPASATISVTVTVPGLYTLSVRVAASSDDAEEKASGSTSLTSGDLELIFDGSNQTVGLRFNGVTIPRGATITSATIQFQVDEASSETTNLSIQGQAADNAPTFAGTKWNVSSRPRTTSAVPWSPVPWTTVGAAGDQQRTPDISSVIQEIVNRPGWSSGNSLAIIITGTGRRVAESYNGLAAAAPLLRVEYRVGS